MSLTHYPTTFLATPALLIAALLLDCLLGEPRKWHPLAGFGNLAHWLEKYMNRQQTSLLSRASGLVAWLALLLPPMAMAYWFTHLVYGWILDILLLYFAIGARSLKEHAMRIYQALQEGNIPQARQAVSMIVSRDTQDLNQAEIATATVESVLENGNDAIFGAIFWFVLFGGTGALMFRLANTLDAMWGYRTPRFLYFGWAAARLDDIFNLIPARLTALSYAICGHTRTALQSWKKQAPSWYSPNAGPVMASGAGALQVTLGGVAPYHGQMKFRPNLGTGPSANTPHIQAAVALVQRSIGLWVGVLILFSIMAGFMHA
ncbi:adenosylcobinamide-phosphate synthase CbiB [Methylobacillus caricis]|uniref:adenosylcobinamide-phosphate synthase CbiB n=1 Tax=Methylobacillus caricis TaxID=1971611 RepID=UPI001D001995|nr:adenosylcobinamide-phosphate synthase CbiB [Methylobacillus caricis]MCB5188227.1 adenosylcobinamide-phosphate synthase CbiB [Methylobacillus caricis]